MTDITEEVLTSETLTELALDVVVETIITSDVLEDSKVEVIIDSAPVVELLDTFSVEVLEEEKEVTNIITEAEQGPPGAPGIAEEDIVYAKRLDMVTPDMFYRGEAKVGSADSEPVWRIRRVTITSMGEIMDMSEHWADGAAEFVHRWDDRANLNYV